MKKEKGKKADKPRYLPERKPEVTLPLKRLKPSRLSCPFISHVETTALQTGAS